MSKTTALPSSSSAVQTHLKNNTFLPSFICCSVSCSYLWVVLVADWNLLPPFPHSFVSEGIRDVYGSGWTLRGQLYTVQRYVKSKLSVASFQDPSSFLLFQTSATIPPRRTRQETGIKFGCEKWDFGACSWLFQHLPKCINASKRALESALS